MEEVKKGQIRLEKKLDDLCSELKSLKEQVTEKDKHIESLEWTVSTLQEELRVVQERAINQEQRSRNYCVRVQGVRIDPELEKSDGHTHAAMDAVYSKVLVPVLKQSMDPRQIPVMKELLETAHTLGKGVVDPTTKKVSPPPIFVRFRDRGARTTVLKGKKVLEKVSVDRKEMKDGVKRYYIKEDLTKEIHVKLMSLVRDESVEAAWSIDGQIRYKLKSEPNKVIKLKSILNPLI